MQDFIDLHQNRLIKLPSQIKMILNKYFENNEDVTLSDKFPFLSQDDLTSNLNLYVHMFNNNGSNRFDNNNGRSIRR